MDEVAMRSLPSRQQTRQLYERMRQKNFSKKVDSNPLTCNRFTSGKRDISVQNALVYLKLRDEGCKRKAALSFGGKSFCKFDSSVEKAGPPSFRVLPLAKKQPQLTHNVES